MSDYVPKSNQIDQVRSYIEREPMTSVAEVSERFGRSSATVRGAMEGLAERGEMSRLRGGAIAVGHSPHELPALEREAVQRKAKQRIGEAAAARVHGGEAVFLGSGTAAIEAASLLTQRRFSGNPSRAGADESLPSEKRAVLDMGGQVLIVADHTKCLRVASAYVAPVTAIDTLITDALAPDQVGASLTTRGNQRHSGLALAAHGWTVAKARVACGRGKSAPVNGSSSSCRS